MPRIADQPPLPRTAPEGPNKPFLDTLLQGLQRYLTQIVTRLNTEVALLTSTTIPLVQPRTTQAAISVTASPFTYTNADKTVEAVYVLGGAITSITFVRNSTNTVMSGGMLNAPQTFLLSPGDALTVVYTTAPTMVKVPL